LEALREEHQDAILISASFIPRYRDSNPSKDQ